MAGANLGQEREHFLHDFKEYLEMELKYSRLELSDCKRWEDRNRWVFWNQQDDDVTLFHDYCVDSIRDVCASRKVRLNIRHALHKLILQPELYWCLVQFWAPTKTSEGRTLLTTQFQPFALGTTDTWRYLDTRNKLCEYRMGMCREYDNSFYADAECAQEQLGLPGRVFLNQLPESTPDVWYYTRKEYPQFDLASSCGISGSWALPVFEHSSHTCVGVLEIVSKYGIIRHGEEFLGRMYDIFQEFGLRCFDGYDHCKMQYWDKKEALTAAFQELKMVYESVCDIHNLPLALAWVSCHSCNNLLQSQFQFSVPHYSSDEEDYDDNTYELMDFEDVSKFWHLRMGNITGRTLPFPSLLYCSDVTQFSIAESSLVPYARFFNLGGWFTMCLQSSLTGDELYVLEFFLPESDENDENILTKLRLILRTMEEYFKTFKLASGQGLGEELSVEVIDFQNGQRSQSNQHIPAIGFIPGLELLQDGGVMLQQVQPDSLQNGKVTTQVDSSDNSKKGKRKTQDEEHKKAGVRIEITLEEILKCSKMRREDAAKELNVGITTLKRRCRDFGINRWPPRNIKDPHPYRPLPVENLRQTPQLNYDLPSNQASASVAHIKPSFQDADMVTIIAICEKNMFKFQLSWSSTFLEMQQELAKRLNLETYDIGYTDENGLLISIVCDADLQYYLHTCRSQGMSSIPIVLVQK